MLDWIFPRAAGYEPFIGPRIFTVNLYWVQFQIQHWNCAPHWVLMFFWNRPYWKAKNLFHFLYED